MAIDRYDLYAAQKNDGYVYLNDDIIVEWGKWCRSTDVAKLEAQMQKFQICATCDHWREIRGNDIELGCDLDENLIMDHLDGCDQWEINSHLATETKETDNGA